MLALDFETYSNQELDLVSSISFMAAVYIQSLPAHSGS